MSKLISITKHPHAIKMPNSEHYAFKNAPNLRFTPDCYVSRSEHKYVCDGARGRVNSSVVATTFFCSNSEVYIHNSTVLMSRLVETVHLSHSVTFNTRCEDSELYNAIVVSSQLSDCKSCNTALMYSSAHSQRFLYAIVLGSPAKFETAAAGLRGGWEGYQSTFDKFTVGCQTHLITEWLKEGASEIPWRIHTTPTTRKLITSMINNTVELNKLNKVFIKPPKGFRFDDFDKIEPIIRSVVRGQKPVVTSPGGIILTQLSKLYDTDLFQRF